MLDPPFREGAKFVQEVASIPIHSMALSLHSGNTTDRLLEGKVLQGKVVLIFLNYILNPNEDTGHTAIEELVLTGIRLTSFLQECFNCSKQVHCSCVEGPSPLPTEMSVRMFLKTKKWKGAA